MPRQAAAPVHGASSLYLRITRGKKSTLYRVIPLPTEPQCASVAWRLLKSDGEQYTVSLGRHGAECDCKDFVVRRQNESKKCKHVESLAAHGLLRPLRVTRKEQSA